MWAKISVGRHCQSDVNFWLTFQIWTVGHFCLFCLVGCSIQLLTLNSKFMLFSSFPKSPALPRPLPSPHSLLFALFSIPLRKVEAVKRKHPLVTLFKIIDYHFKNYKLLPYRTLYSLPCFILIHNTWQHLIYWKT